MTNVLMLIVAAVLVAIGGARVAYNVSSDPGGEPVQVAWSQDRMEFVTWNNGKWTAWVHAGSFELSPQTSGKWSRHANPSIAFTNWDGEQWQAKIDGMDSEVADIRRVTQAAAEQERERIVADAHVVADRIQRTAVSAVERETRRARVALREEASELAVELAAGLLKNGVTEQDRDRLVDEFVERLETENAGGSA